MHTASIKLHDPEVTRTVGAAPGRMPTARIVLVAYVGAWLLSMVLFSLGPDTLSGSARRAGGGVYLLGALGIGCFWVISAVSHRLTRRRNYRTWLTAVPPVVFILTGILLRQFALAPATALAELRTESSMEMLARAMYESRPLLSMAYCLAGSYLLATSFAWKKRAKRLGRISFRIAIVSALSGWAAIIWGLVGVT